MRYIFLYIFVVLTAFEVEARGIPSISSTHSTPFVLESASFVSGGEVLVAGVYWLPDYLKNNIDRNDLVQDENELKEGSKDCEKLGYGFPGFVSGLDKYNYTYFSAAAGIKCYKNFRCKDEYSKTSCPEWYELGGNSCTDASGTRYNSCVAKACPSGSASLPTKAGYDKVATGEYSGGSACYDYVAKACGGYGAIVSGLGWDCADSCLSGTVLKYKCVARACGAGSLNPGCDGANYKTVENGSYSGNSACKSCEAIPCPGGKSCVYGCSGWDNNRAGMCGKICVECNSCYPGGSSGCVGPTTGCGPDEVEVSSCADCSGVRHYRCRAKTCGEKGLLDIENYWCNGAMKCWIPASAGPNVGPSVGSD